MSTLLLLCLLLKCGLKKSTRKLPPGPYNFPIFGCLPLLDSKAPHLTIDRFIKNYGKTIFVEFGQIPCVIMADPKIIKRCFIKSEYYISGHLNWEYRMWKF